MDEIKITIIGAGVVGLALAAELSKKHDNILVLEKNEKFGMETSSRNSEVIHSGIYYRSGSLKTKLCRQGAELLYEFCGKKDIPHKRISKLIVASCPEEVIKLKLLFEQGRQNEVKEIYWYDQADVKKLEPQVKCLNAVFLPHTGIIDSHRLMEGLYQEGRNRNVMYSFHTTVNRIGPEMPGFRIGIEEDPDFSFRSRIVINSAGLFSDKIASLAGIDIDKEGYRIAFCKGSYFAYSGKPPLQRLVYPVPHEELTGLGVHATLDLNNRLRFGPDTEYVENLDYGVDGNKSGGFYEKAACIISGLRKEAFHPDTAGIRPKIKGEGFHDFIIMEEKEKGLPGLIDLVGIESPGLTACLAISRYVADMVTHLV
ncbi:MAG: NAD(P)/FAD-dependent oxidoreductase [bacterium]|nr:NAD(P)/FAD-dependent oxidoreductase [bacterium]